MSEFIAALCLLALGYLVGYARANAANRETLKAIYRGKAYPDENGNVGWDIP